MRTTPLSSLLLLAAVAAFAACSDDTPTAPAPVPDPAYAPADAVALCHRNEDTAGFELVMVPATGRAVDKHLEHGDAMPGDPIPQGFTPFGPDCSLPFLAIAYTDRDPTDGDVYRAGLDRLIATLIDTDGSQDASTGDEIYVFGFPVDFEASAFGSVAVPSHRVGNVLPGCTSTVVFDEAGALFQWSNRTEDPQWETFASESPDGYGALTLTDFRPPSSGYDKDVIRTDQGRATTEPDRSLELSDAEGVSSDDAFLDVQLNCAG